MAGPPEAFDQGSSLFGQTHMPRARDAQSGVAAFRAQQAQVPQSRYGLLFNDLMDEQTSAIQNRGNEVELLPDGMSSFAEREKLIRNATQSVFLQTFIFNDDATGWHTAKMLAEKAQQGVKCCVIYDGVGSNRADNKIFDFMRAAGVEVREYADPYKAPLKLNTRWHEKFLIVDGQVGIAGGMNIADEYAYGGSSQMIMRLGEKPMAAWRDMDVRVSGPVLYSIVTRFQDNWARLGKPMDEGFVDQTIERVPAAKLKRGVNVRMVTNEAGSSRTPITNAYVLAISAAQKKIVIENPYFIPTKEVRDALVEACQRGVDVVVMTNSAESNDMPLLPDIARHYYDELVDAGVRIFEKHGGTLHSKTASFDDEFSIIGSANLNRRSSGLDSETVLCISDPLTARSLSRRFEMGIGECKELQARELADEDWLTNAWQWCVSLLARNF